MAVLKIVATRGEIFNLKFTKYRLAAWLRPDPLGELKRSPRPPSRNKGALLLGGKGREGRGGRRDERGGERGGRGRGREREVEFPHLFNPTLTTAYMNGFSGLTPAHDTIWHAGLLSHSQLRYDYDTTVPRRFRLRRKWSKLRFAFDSTAIRLYDTTTTKNWHVHFLVASNWKQARAIRRSRIVVESQL